MGSHISKLIQKIQRDWERAGVENNHISRIDKDILINSIRELYDQVSDLQTAASKKVQQNEPQNELFDDPAPQRGHEPSPELPRAADEPPQQRADEPENATPPQQPEAMPVDDAHKKAPAEKVPERRSEKQEKPDPPESSPKKTSAHPLNDKMDQAKTTMDLFTPTKTLSDMYKDNRDNSLAAKINQHRISDIRAAIGINDKFLMINHIFNGEMATYNRAIEKLNNFDFFHEALHYIDELKATSLTDENAPAFNKLLEIVKRKFH